MKDLLQIIDETDHTCFHSYRRIAEKLMNDYKLCVGDNNFYRIVECEFYFRSKKHDDPYVHGHARQKESIGEWYFHGSGLDITLSTGDTYGGILIRGLTNVNRDRPVPSREDAIIGPLNVCTEIFKQFGGIIAEKPIHFGLVDISREKMGAAMPDAKVFSIPRVGLNDTKDNDDNFCRRPYRFISFLHLQHRESEKIKKYLIEESKEPISLEDYKKHVTGSQW